MTGGQSGHGRQLIESKARGRLRSSEQ
jgi:hypothetical protein